MGKVCDPTAGGDAGMPVRAGVAKCDMPCPDVEIEINPADTKTAGVDDDLVQLRTDHPVPYTPSAECRIRATSTVPNRATIVLTNPDGHLSFYGRAKTHNVDVPNDGSWVTFFIHGEVGSTAIGDAVIEAHCNTADGALKGKKAVTVFWFDGHIDIAAGSKYTLRGKLYAPEGPAAAVTITAQASIRPAAVNPAAPQVAKLRISIMQIGKAGRVGVLTRTNPTHPKFHGNDPQIVVPKKQQLTINQPVTVNDADSGSAPLYVTPAQCPNSQQPVGGPPAVAWDNPSNQWSVYTRRDPVADVDYTVLESATCEGEWIDFAVVYDTETHEICVLRQRGWKLNANSAAGGDQKAVPDPADAPATDDPRINGPFANDVSNDPANSVIAPLNPADTVTLPNPHP